MSNSNGGIVYSTRHGQMCPDCGKPTSDCVCKRGKGKGRAGGQGSGRQAAGGRSRGATPGASVQNVPADGIVRVSRETKRRKGKGVTLITGVPLEGAELDDLARSLKQKCGCGGAVKDGVIEIQGDHRDSLIQELEKRGYKVKKAGG